jgi:hypothetical protein
MRPARSPMTEVAAGRAIGAGIEVAANKRSEFTASGGRHWARIKKRGDIEIVVVGEGGRYACVWRGRGGEGGGGGYR